MKKRQLLGLILAVAILAGMFLIPVSELFPYAARNTLGLLCAVIVLLVTEAFPIGVICMVTVALMVVFGCVKSVPEALSGYTNQILFFVLASFGISEALTRVPLSKRLLVALMKAFGKNTNQLLLSIMLCVTLLSSVISNVAAAAVFIPIVQKFLDAYDDPEDRKRTAKCYMIALPVASMIGGMMTPAGSSINMLAIGLLEKHAGITIPFVEWMLMGIPLAATMLPIAWITCIRVYKPAAIAQSKIQQYLEHIELPDRMSGKEIYVLCIVASMLVLWILSSWYSIFNITVVALIGLMLFFVPGKEVMTWRQFTGCISWEAYFLIGTMISLGAAISSSGLSGWLTATIFPAQFAAPLAVVIGFIALLTFLLLVVIPVAPALVTMLAIPLIGFAAVTNVSPYLLIATLAFCSANCYLLPLDTVPLMTFATGDYGMFDMPKSTVWLQIAMVILSSIWLPIVGKILGIA